MWLSLLDFAHCLVITLIRDAPETLNLCFNYFFFYHVGFNDSISENEKLVRCKKNWDIVTDK